MDPEAALAELVQSVQCRDWDRVEEVANGLLSCLEHRGFPPITIGPRELGDEWHRSIAIFACHLATSKVRDIRRRRQRRTGA